MKKKEKETAERETRLVRIDAAMVNEVEKHVKATHQSIGGFFLLAADEKLKKEKK